MNKKKKKKLILITLIVITILSIGFIIYSIFNTQKNEIVEEEKSKEEFHFELLDKKIELKIGQSQIIKTYIIGDYSFNDIVWTISDNNIISLEGNKVTALKSGTATITAKLYDVESKCDVKVNYLDIDSINLDKSKITIFEKASHQLNVTFSPDKDIDKNLKWESKNPEIATVDEKGNISGLKEGSTTITVTTSNGISQSCDVDVYKKVDFVCNGTIDRNGTKISVNSNGIKFIKKQTWVLNNKVKEQNSSSLTLDGYAVNTATVKILYEDNSLREVKCTIKDNRIYKFIYDDIRPVQCGDYTAEAAQALNNKLASAINEAGKGTRAGIVEAARFLVGGWPYSTGYQGNKDANMYKMKGLNIGHDNAWGCRNRVSRYVNGMDCVGLIEWPFYQNDTRVSYCGDGGVYPIAEVVNKLQVGDTLVIKNKPPANCSYSHDAIIIGITDDYIYLAGNVIGVINKHALPTNLYEGYTHARIRSYAQDGNVTKMWVQDY